MAINFDHQLNKVTTGNSDIDFDITGSLKLPVGTTAQRTGTLAGGELRFNSTNNLFEGYDGTDWLSLGALEDNVIGSLSDVDTTGITTGQVLKWDGTQFVAADDVDTTLVLSGQSIGDLGDVDITATPPTIGQVLKWDGTKFIPGDDEEDLSNNTTSDLAEGTNLYYTQGRFDTAFTAKDTDDLTEGSTNLYYTQGRFDTAFTAKDTDGLSEGSTNLYYTDGRFDTAFTAKDTDGLSEGSTNLYYTQGRFDTAFTAKDTDGLSEGSTNLYYTDGRVDTRIGATSVDALSDVDTTAVAPTNGQTLVWNAAQSKWLPGTISGGSGGGIEEGDEIAFAIALGS